MGCCLGVILLAGAPRLALAIWWFSDPTRIVGTFAGWITSYGGVTAPVWIWPLAGFLLLPWTTIAYVFVSPGGLTPVKWIILGIGLLLDLSAHGGGGRVYQQSRA
jgi:hypothetical protein